MRFEECGQGQAEWGKECDTLCRDMREDVHILDLLEQCTLLKPINIWNRDIRLRKACCRH